MGFLEDFKTSVKEQVRADIDAVKDLEERPKSESLKALYNALVVKKEFGAVEPFVLDSIFDKVFEPVEMREPIELSKLRKTSQSIIQARDVKRYKQIPWQWSEQTEPMVTNMMLKSNNGKQDKRPATNHRYRRQYVVYLLQQFVQQQGTTWKVLCWHKDKDKESSSTTWLEFKTDFKISSSNIDFILIESEYYQEYEKIKEDEAPQKITEGNGEATKDKTRKKDTQSDVEIPNRNIIFFGPPGTGKSYQVNQLISQSEATIGKSTWKGFELKVNKVKPDGTLDPAYNEAHVKLFQRVTFHPEYSYYDFVGSYKPAVGRKYEKNTIVFKQVLGDHFPVNPTLETGKIKTDPEKEDEEHSLAELLGASTSQVKKFGASPVVYYDFEPGPFSLALVEALKNPKKDVVMLIEEINRGNCAAIFGDVFQLLDRDKNGIGEYSISIGSEWGAWLEGALKDIPKDTMERYFSCSNTQYKICLPSNLYLLATMNTADQGLFPMDSAFKRRWFMKYIGMNHANTVTLIFKVPVQLGNDELKQKRKTLEWNIFRNNINKKILECTKNPDKRLGPFFVKKAEFAHDATGVELFFSKVVYYLWSVLKPGQRGKIFTDVTQTTSLDELETRYFNGNEVFTSEVLKK